MRQQNVGLNSSIVANMIKIIILEEDSDEPIYRARNNGIKRKIHRYDYKGNSVFP